MERIKEEDVVRQFNVVAEGEEEAVQAMFPTFVRQVARQEDYI